MSVLHIVSHRSSSSRKSLSLRQAPSEFDDFVPDFDSVNFQVIVNEKKQAAAVAAQQEMESHLSSCSLSSRSSFSSSSPSAPLSINTSSPPRHSDNSRLSCSLTSSPPLYPAHSRLSLSLPPVNFLTNHQNEVRVPSMWKFEVKRDVTRFGFLKNRVSWTLIIKDAPITIELCHSTVGGKRAVRINNNSVWGKTKTRKRVVELGARTSFSLVSHGITYDCYVQDSRSLGPDTFEYELFISSSTSQHVTFAEAREMWLQHADW